MQHCGLGAAPPITAAIAGHSGTITPPEHAYLGDNGLAEGSIWGMVLLLPKCYQLLEGFWNSSCGTKLPESYFSISRVWF